MASFEVNGIEGFVLSMQEMAKLPDCVVDDILQEGAKVVKKAHTEAIAQHFTTRTGALIGSPTIFLKKNGTKRYALVYPGGQHHTYRAKKGKGVARNADVGFVHEFGGHGNTAKNWMRTANEKCAEEMTDAEFKAYDAWLKILDL